LKVLGHDDGGGSNRRQGRPATDEVEWAVATSSSSIDAAESPASHKYASGPAANSATTHGIDVTDRSCRITPPTPDRSISKHEREP